ncbi:ABC transporter permease [Candidatus Thiothrix anitrata]|nr:ABC transporter permease [Candidatus Thiothrix anitrata]
MTNGSLLHSLKIQQRVIYALLMREILTRYGRNNIGFLWLIFEPLFFVSVFVVLAITYRFDNITAVPVVAFAVTGYGSLILWRNMADRSKSAISSNAALMHHKNVKVNDILFARLLLEMLGVSAAFLVLVLTFLGIGMMPPPEDIFTLLMGWLLLAWFGFAFGLCLAVPLEKIESFNRMWGYISLVLFMLSGAGFMVDWLPKPMQDFMLWIPMVHGVEMLRNGYFGSLVITYESPDLFDRC